MDSQGERMVQARNSGAPGTECESPAGEVLGLWEVGRVGLASQLLRKGLERSGGGGPPDLHVCPPPVPAPPRCVPEAPRFESIMEDVEVGAGETARFAVVVEGKPLPDIMWYKVRG